ncbi:hypothetical protein FGO68_gene7262 [Halteria grandinella]|uniref:RING-type domain-containing protein n=1 Tax=Halteria grandinella TaxID=5974 RepID=A0A8J8NNZ5_HALGN|nr:hypothetical protein FGO68_gene7262 [Halteria grandinella]
MRRRDELDSRRAQRIRAANPEVFQRLPEIVYNNPFQTKEESKEDNARLCAVCHCEYAQGDVLKQLPCNHQFHKGCLMPWFDTRNTCPLCRVELRA